MRALSLQNTITLDTTIISTRPKGLPILSGAVQSGGASAMAMNPSSVDTMSVSPFERGIAAAHQTWVRGSSVFRFVTVNAASDIDVPRGAFVTPNGTESHLELVASQADGSPLPNWLSFNSISRVFSGTPPENSFGTLDLKVVGHDMFGHEAQVDIHVVIGHEHALTELIDATEPSRVFHERVEMLQHDTSALVLAPLPDSPPPQSRHRAVGKPSLRSQLRHIGPITYSRAARELLDRTAL
ncbi:MAG: putative Ig domain-containing protein [Acetobacter sp.]